jgi:hypothetical protein
MANDFKWPREWPDLSTNIEAFISYYKLGNVCVGNVFLCSLTARTRAGARVVKTFTYLWTDSLQICWVHLTINWGISVCLCVCVSVCVSVCPAIRFHSSQRIFSKFGGKLSTVHYTFRGLYSLCVHATRVRARAVRMY